MAGYVSRLVIDFFPLALPTIVNVVQTVSCDSRNITEEFTSLVWTIHEAHSAAPARPVRCGRY